jgi:hypothetical protein
MPYLICDKCNSSYDFRPDEENIFCNRYDCGNTLKYYDSLEEYHQEKRTKNDNDLWKYHQVIIRIILYGVKETPVPVNLNTAIDILQGSGSEEILTLDLNNSYFHGFLSDFSYKELYNFIIKLIMEDYLQVKTDLSNTLVLTGKALDIIDYTETEGYFQKRMENRREYSGKLSKNDKIEEQKPACDEKLYEKLRQLRNSIAREKKVPSYIICKNESLEEMAQIMPQNDISMMPIKWIGPKFIEKYGLEFQEIIKDYCAGTGNSKKQDTSKDDVFDLKDNSKKVSDVSKDPEIPDDPVYNLLYHSDGSFRAHNAYLLGETRNPLFVEALCKATRDSDGNVRRLSASALSKIGDNRAEDVLIDLLNDDKPQVRQYAIKALGKLGSTKSLPPLDKLLDDPEIYNRNSAQTAILRIKNRG